MPGFWLPKYAQWAERTEAALFTGSKQALLAFSDQKLVADLIWQPHKTMPGFVEWKNLRVHPSVRMRDFGRFLLRQAEAICGFPAAVCDVRRDQTGIVRFLRICGYTPAAVLPLYDSARTDVIMVKTLAARPPSFSIENLQ